MDPNWETIQWIYLTQVSHGTMLLGWKGNLNLNYDCVDKFEVGILVI